LNDVAFVLPWRERAGVGAVPATGCVHMTPRISGFVVAYNRESLIETCLRGARFVDQLVVIDKSSTDATAAIAGRFADTVIRVPWSPTVEETRALALSHCVHDWVLFLDDDEMLSAEAVRFLHGRHFDRARDVHYLPLKHYILGRFDPNAHYWPEHHVRFFRRGAVEFRPTVHGGVAVLTANVAHIPEASGICIHHLSHPDVAGWIEKTNRYTYRPDRVRPEADVEGFAAFAHARIEHWMGRTRPSGAEDYPAAVAVLRAIYDIVDRLKTYEEGAGESGAERFAAACAELQSAYDVLETRFAIPTGHDPARPVPVMAPSPETTAPPVWTPPRRGLAGRLRACARILLGG